MLTVLLALAGCSGDATVELPEPNPLIRPAGIEVPAHRAGLTELLPVADVEVETRRIDFADLGSRKVNLLDGWSLERDLGKAWGTGERSSLSFTLIPRRDLELRLRCAPFHYSGSPRQSVTVVVNGEEIERLDLSRRTRSYGVHLPASVLRLGANHLEFRYGYASVPAEVVEGSTDARELAVMWDWIRFGSGEPLDQGATTAADGSRLQIPFASRVNYYLEAGQDSALRIAGVDAWSAEPPATSEPDAEMRLLVELAVDGGPEEQVVEVAPVQITGPIEVPLPVELSGQKVRVALSAYRVGGRGGDTETVGLSMDLPEVVTSDESFAARFTGTRPPSPAIPFEGRPNIVVYMIDTLRADHLGCYGYEVPTSPNIDRFAADATLFERPVAQASWTKPSVATLFTGLHPQTHGTNHRGDALARDAETVAEALWYAGYDTAAIFTNGNLHRTGLGQGFKTYRYLREGSHDAVYVLSDELHDEAVEWLDSRDPDKPFFLYLHAADPHSPYTPPAGFLERIGKTVADPAVGLLDNVKELERHAADDAVVRDLVALYDAEIAHNDHNFGRLISELERRGLYDSTLIVLVSDHGEEFFDHGWWQHGKTLYEEQLAVPLIVRFPGGLGAGTRSDDLAQHIDIYPTILQAAGLEVADSIPGRSLLWHLNTADGPAPVRAVSYLSVDDRVAESLTLEHAKLILHHYDYGQGRLLFDLSQDPDESTNLWTERPVLAGYLMSALKAFNLAQQSRLEPEESEFDAEQIERLRALGYLN